jgi:hypothetical protein
MASFSFDSPLRAGKCATPVAIGAVAATIDFKINGAAHRVGTLKVVLVSSVAWLYSDTPASGKTLPVAANQHLTIPLYDNLVIEATSAGGASTLCAMMVEGE